MMRALLSTFQSVINLISFVKDPSEDGNLVRNQLYVILNTIEITILSSNITLEEIGEVLMKSLNEARY